VEPVKKSKAAIHLRSEDWPTEEEKCPSLWQILEERDGYVNLPFQASKGEEATWARLCKDLEDPCGMRHLRKSRPSDKLVKMETRHATHDDDEKE